MVRHLAGRVVSDPVHHALHDRGTTQATRTLLTVLVVLALLPLLVVAFLPLIAVFVALAWFVGPRWAGSLASVARVPGGQRHRPVAPAEALRFRVAPAGHGPVTEVVLHRRDAHLELGDDVEVTGIVIRGRLRALRVRNLTTGVTDLATSDLATAAGACVGLLLALTVLSGLLTGA